MKFLDGPAKGTNLVCARSPLFLRAVLNVETGKWDALDLIGDVVGDDEEAYAYRRVGEASFGFLDYSDKKTGRRRGMAVNFSRYEYLDEQPTQDAMRDNEKWREWCFAQQKKDKEKKGADLQS